MPAKTLNALDAYEPDRDWRFPYFRWTATDLVLANYLRPVPLPLPELCRYRNHKLSSLIELRRVLRRKGLLLDDFSTNVNHRDNINRVGSPHFQPLPDPGQRPLTRASMLAIDSAASAAEEPTDPDDPDTPPEQPLEPPNLPQEPLQTPPQPSLPPRYDRRYFASTLEQWISSGKAGAQTPRFIETWADLVGNTSDAGPPAPLTHSDYVSRLVRLLSACPRESALAAIAAFNAQEPHADPISPRKAPSGPLEPSPPQAEEAQVELRPRNL